MNGVNYKDDNPIINNRIVSSKTFAIRLKNFIEAVQVSDAASEEEKEYLLNVANRLLKYQIETATDESEISYLKRVV
jgi:ribulose 1,5-bisphosphate carboxylase large subunit-like protein